ncbi:DUF5455 family protein [Pseudomonas mohnii]
MFNLAKFFLGAFTTVAGWFMGMFSRKTAIALAVTTVILAMTTALSLALKGAIAALQIYATPVVPASFFVGFGALCPENADVCLTAMFSARVTVWAYNFNKDLLKMYLGGI